jgi:hypothetical protein
MRFTMFKILILFVILPCVGFAKSEKFWVQFGKEKLKLERFDEGFLSLKCQDCLALSALKKKIKIEQKELTNKNPGSVQCEKLNGKVRIGKLYSGHSQSFCFFKDKSFLSTNLLH